MKYETPIWVNKDYTSQFWKLYWNILTIENIFRTYQLFHEPHMVRCFDPGWTESSGTERTERFYEFWSYAKQIQCIK